MGLFKHTEIQATRLSNVARKGAGSQRNAIFVEILSTGGLTVESVEVPPCKRAWQTNAAVMRKALVGPSASVQQILSSCKHQGQPQHLRPQGRPPTVAANGVDSSITTMAPVAGVSKPPEPAAPAIPVTVVANHGSPSGPPAPNSSRGPPGNGHMSPGTMQHRKRGATPPGASIPPAATTVLAQSPIVPRLTVRSNTSGRGSGGGGGSGGAGELARSMSGPAHGTDGLGSSSAAAVGRAGARPVTAAAGGGCCAVRGGYVFAK